MGESELSLDLLLNSSLISTFTDGFVLEQHEQLQTTIVLTHTRNEARKS
jgi:hypothetical protein